MPVHQNGTHLGLVSAVVGSYTMGKAIYHVGLLSAQCDITLGQKVTVYEMGPPLGKSEIGADLMAWIDGLSADQLEGMDAWALKLVQSEVRIPYMAYPASTAVRDEVSGALRYKSFSCAGFVERCYRDAARIRLIVDESLLPPIAIDILQDVWSDQLQGLQRPKIRRRIGLAGDGPWRVLMPAYLFHAIGHFDRQGHNAGPYQPTDGDWKFP